MYGIDVSHYQRDIDWAKVRGANIEFAVLKAMYETSYRPDEYFEKNYRGCQANGLQTGSYIFIGSKSIINPKADAESYLNILNGRKLEYGVWIDAESKTLRAQGKQNVQNIIMTEAEIIRSAGYEVGVYVNFDWYKNVLTDLVKNNYKIWCARYPKNDNGTIKNNLSVNGLKNIVAWQYSSKGKVPGIIGNVDMDVDFGYMKRKSDNEIAKEVIEGKWGTAHTSPTRKARLTAAGYNYINIQNKVNSLLKSQ